MQEVLQRVRAGDQADETDHIYTCLLTMEPFRDPVCTPDGNSYERAALLEHLKKVGREAVPHSRAFRFYSIVRGRDVILSPATSDRGSISRSDGFRTSFSYILSLIAGW
jgi:hypothetical protein